MAEAEQRKDSLRSSAKVHVLNFFTDEDDGAALTVSVNGVGFHIIADIEEFGDEVVLGEYRELVFGVRGEEGGVGEGEDKSKEDEDEEECRTSQDNKQQALWCTCRQPEKEGQRMIACENESCPYQWYHFTCVGIDSAPDGKWICPACSNEQTAPTSTPSPNDSGVDVTTPRKNQTATSQQKRSEEDIEAAEKELQNWMLTPLASIFAELAPASAKPKQPTLTQWYNRQTHFYALKSEETELVAAELEESDELTQRMRNLIPKLQMPKYITEMGVRMFSAGEMIVIEESEMLGPLHPSRVRLCDKDESKDESKPAEYFIKIVDPIQPAATKRELKFLHKIEKAGLDKLFNVPRIIGLVSPPDFNFNANANAKETNSPANIIAFLQTPIPSPIPLTTLLSPDIPQTKRTKWSRECQRIIRILHENDIVFGDCKADNFLVDRDDELWIIDFGGSYTEGWIDRELAETREGDRMALGKIVGVLEDPVGNTIGDGGDGEDEGKKRRRGEEEDGDADGEFESAVREKKARKA